MDQYEDIVRLWRSWGVKTEADIDLRLDNFRVLFAYNSGKIENDAVTYHDTREIFANGRVGRTLLNYYLMLRDHPPTIIYDADKAAY